MIGISWGARALFVEGRSEEVLRVGQPFLELRIHGVNNTSPASMLDRPECQIEQVDGDTLGSFWRVKTRRLRERGPDDHGYVPDGVRREAYSWGGMARNSPGASGSGVTSTVLNAVGRIAWTLLLPFGITNIAYWSRELPAAREPGPRGWAGRGAAAVRVFGLGLTVLLTSTGCEVALDLYAVQCRPRDGAGPCRALPSVLERLGGADVASRLANASLVPLAILIALWFLTTRARLRYEEVTPPPRPVPSIKDEDEPEPMLAREGLWRGGEMVRGLTQLHVAASALVITIASAWPALFATGPSCRVVADLLGNDCLAQMGAAPGRAWFILVLAASAVLLALVIALTVVRSHDAPDLDDLEAGRQRFQRRATVAVLVLALLVLLAEIVILHTLSLTIITRAYDADVPLLGINALPVIVAAVLLGIAISALAWRSVRWGPGLCGVLVTVGLLAVNPLPQIGIVLILIAVVALCALARLVDEKVRSTVAWSGTGPGLLLGIALVVALALSTVVVVGAGDWLNGDANASQLVTCGTGSDSASTLCLPPIYGWFAGTLLVALALIAALILGLLALVAARNARGKYLPDATRPTTPKQPQVEAVCNMAALAQRAEPVTGIVAALGLIVAALSTIGSALPSQTLPTTGPIADLGQELVDWGALATGGVAVLVVAGVSGTGLLHGRRPLGLAWDLLCVLPRAAHPFSAPCYAERAVPEVAGRVVRWLNNTNDPRCRVVLSAHSLGAVLATAVVFVLDKPQRKSVSLLTYGVQLRAYFSRIFPDILGPDTLGVPACLAPSLWSRDPWSTEVSKDSQKNHSSFNPDPASLRRQLNRRWISLWRRTDYLGFPACDYGRNDVDRPAEETLHDGPYAAVQTHSFYPRVPAYKKALAGSISCTAVREHPLDA